MLPPGLVRTRASAVGKGPRRFGQLLDDRLHLPAQRIGAESERAHHAHHHDDRARHARNPDSLELRHEGIQRVGNEDSEQQGDEERLRQIERANDRDHGKQRERDAARVHGHSDRRDDGRRSSACRAQRRPRAGFGPSWSLAHGLAAYSSPCGSCRVLRSQPSSRIRPAERCR